MALRRQEAKDLKSGSYVLINDKPCEVQDTSSAMTGKHGHVKMKIETKGILDGKTRRLKVSGDEKVEVPLIDKKDAQVLAISGDSTQLMDLESYETFEVQIPNELKGKLKEGEEVIYWIVMGKKLLKRVKS